MDNSVITSTADPLTLKLNTPHAPTMKTTSFIRILCLLTLTATLVFDARAGRYVIGLSPNYSRTDGQTVFKTLLLFVLEGAAPGDELLVYDALQQAPVTRFTLPKQGLFTGNPRARAQQLKAEIAQLQQFLTGERPRPAGAESAVHAPLFLDLAGTQLRRQGEPLHVILIGSPLHLNVEDEAFNLEDCFPSDGHLLVSQRESPFGTALKASTLEGVIVHQAYLRPCFRNDYHQERVTRFLSLFVQQQKGILSTFAADLGLAFQRAKDNVREPCVRAQVDTTDIKVELRHVTPRQVPIWFGPTNVIQKVVEAAAIAPVQGSSSQVNPAPVQLSAAVENTPPVSEQVVTSLPAASFPVNSLPGKVGIGIMWSQPVDCDLYVKPSPSAHELFYRNTRSREGRYYHDYRNANVGVDYEYVELNRAVDLSTVSAWINYYKGRTEGVRGLVVVHHNGRTYHGEYLLAASMGNGGQESQSRSGSRYWTRIDLLKIVGINAPGNTATQP